MIGGLILRACLQRENVNQITSIVRKSGDFKHPKLKEVVHTDFMDYSDVENTALSNQDICFFCLGVYTGAVSTEEFKKITVDYTKAFAESLRRGSPEVAFCFLSGDHADQTEKSRVLFARQKGIAENALLRLQFKHLYLFRPSYIYPVTPRKEPNLFYKVLRVIYGPLHHIFPTAGVPSTTVADAMVDAAFNAPDKIIFSHLEILWRAKKPEIFHSLTPTS
jgi:uncharacterized protein YbjT (DUF2867 family)